MARLAIHRGRVRDDGILALGRVGFVEAPEGGRVNGETVDDLISCSCHDHAIHLHGWDDGDLFMTLWSPIASKEWGRWHWVWQSLRGRWSGDNELVLDTKHATELRDALTRHLGRVAKAESVNDVRARTGLPPLNDPIADEPLYVNPNRVSRG